MPSPSLGGQQATCAEAVLTQGASAGFTLNSLGNFTSLPVSKLWAAIHPMNNENEKTTSPL
jgi:hypothetical protein